MLSPSRYTLFRHRQCMTTSIHPKRWRLHATLASDILVTDRCTYLDSPLSERYTEGAVINNLARTRATEQGRVDELRRLLCVLISTHWSLLLSCGIFTNNEKIEVESWREPRSWVDDRALQLGMLAATISSMPIFCANSNCWFKQELIQSTLSLPRSLADNPLFTWRLAHKRSSRSSLPSPASCILQRGFL